MSLIRPPRAMILDGDVPTPPEPDPTWTHSAPPMVPAPRPGRMLVGTTGMLYNGVEYLFGGYTTAPHCLITSGD